MLPNIVATTSISTTPPTESPQSLPDGLFRNCPIRLILNNQTIHEPPPIYQEEEMELDEESGEAIELDTDMREEFRQTLDAKSEDSEKGGERATILSANEQQDKLNSLNRASKSSEKEHSEDVEGKLIIAEDETTNDSTSTTIVGFNDQKGGEGEITERHKNLAKNAELPKAIREPKPPTPEIPLETRSPTKDRRSQGRTQMQLQIMDLAVPKFNIRAKEGAEGGGDNQTDSKAKQTEKMQPNHRQQNRQPFGAGVRPPLQKQQFQGTGPRPAATRLAPKPSKVMRSPLSQRRPQFPNQSPPVENPEMNIRQPLCKTPGLGAIKVTRGSSDSGIGDSPMTPTEQQGPQQKLNVLPTANTPSTSAYFPVHSTPATSNSLVEENQRLKERSQQLEAEFNEIKARLDEQKRINASQEASISSLNNKLKAAEGREKRVRKEKEDLEKEKTEMEKEKREAIQMMVLEKTRRTKEEAKVSDAQKEKDKAVREKARQIEELRKELEQANSSKKKLQFKLDMQREEHEKELCNAKAEREKEWEKKYNDVVTKKQEMKLKWKKRKSEMKNSIDAKTKELEQHKLDGEKAKQEKESLAQEMSTLQDEFRLKQESEKAHIKECDKCEMNKTMNQIFCNGLKECAESGCTLCSKKLQPFSPNNCPTPSNAKAPSNSSVHSGNGGHQRERGPKRTGEKNPTSGEERHCKQGRIGEIHQESYSAANSNLPQPSLTPSTSTTLPSPATNQNTQFCSNEFVRKKEEETTDFSSGPTSHLERHQTISGANSDDDEIQVIEQNIATTHPTLTERRDSGAISEHLPTVANHFAVTPQEHRQSSPFTTRRQQEMETIVRTTGMSADHPHVAMLLQECMSTIQKQKADSNLLAEAGVNLLTSAVGDEGYVNSTAQHNITLQTCPPTVLQHPHQIAPAAHNQSNRKQNPDDRRSHISELLSRTLFDGICESQPNQALSLQSQTTASDQQQQLQMSQSNSIVRATETNKQGRRGKQQQQQIPPQPQQQYNPLPQCPQQTGQLRFDNFMQQKQRQNPFVAMPAQQQPQPSVPFLQHQAQPSLIFMGTGPHPQQLATMQHMQQGPPHSSFQGHFPGQQQQQGCLDVGQFPTAPAICIPIPPAATVMAHGVVYEFCQFFAKFPNPNLSDPEQLVREFMASMNGKVAPKELTGMAPQLITLASKMLKNVAVEMS